MAARSTSRSPKRGATKSLKSSPAAKAKAPAKTPPSKSSATVPPELAAFRSAGARGFFGAPDYGEVRFLKAGQRPTMASDAGLPWGIGEWVAEEADGAAIGYLRLPGVPLTHAPIIRITNEGSLEATGLALVDHFAHATLAAGSEHAALLAFCTANGLAGPRPSAAITAALRKAKLAKLGDQPPKVDAAAWIATVDGSRPAVPAKAAPPAKPAPAPKPVAGKPVSPLSEYAYGGVGPDGAPWVSLRDGKRTLIARWTGAAFELVAAHPDSAMSLAAVGDALVTTALYSDGAIWRDGRWTIFKAPEEGDGALIGDGIAAYFVARRGPIYQFDGAGLAPMPALAHRTEATPLVDGSGALLLVGGETSGARRGDVTRVAQGKIATLPRCPEASVGAACVAGGVLVVYDHTSLHTLPLAGKGAWRTVKLGGGGLLSALVPLTTGKVLLVRQGHALETFDPATGTIAAAGTRLLKEGGATMAVLPTPDGGALFVGGTVGIKSKGDAPMYPQLWRAGEVTALPGLEKATAAQAKAQAKGSMFPW